MDLGEIFMANGANETFGLCLLHNHFHVDEGDAMVEVVTGNSSATRPRKGDWLHHQQEQRQQGSLRRASIPQIVPSMLGFTSANNGDLRPFEFLDVGASDFAGFRGRN